MRTLHFGLRVADRERSLAFYAALGYEIVGRVPGTSLGDLTMIKLPGDPFVAIELVSGSAANVDLRPIARHRAREVHDVEIPRAGPRWVETNR